jgi:hypothetical protein
MPFSLAEKDVLSFWLVGRKLRYGRYHNLRITTDGRKLFYGSLVIGWTRRNGNKALLSYTAKSGYFKSLELSYIINETTKFLDRSWPNYDIYIPKGPIGRGGLPTKKFRLIENGPKVRTVKGLKFIQNERRGDKLGW